jgi:hypothetical protein
LDLRKKVLVEKLICFVKDEKSDTGKIECAFLDQLSNTT